jgi:hypothetical protein
MAETKPVTIAVARGTPAPKSGRGGVARILPRPCAAGPRGHFRTSTLSPLMLRSPARVRPHLLSQPGARVARANGESRRPASCIATGGRRDWTTRGRGLNNKPIDAPLGADEAPTSRGPPSKVCVGEDIGARTQARCQGKRGASRKEVVLDRRLTRFYQVAFTSPSAAASDHQDFIRFLNERTGPARRRGTAFDWLAARGNDAMVLLGQSLGSGVAVNTAVERPAAAVALISPYLSMLEEGSRRRNRPLHRSGWTISSS